MKILHYDDLDILSFGGIRERILVMDSREFGDQKREDTWQGEGPLRYLAHAAFRPGGSTGRHSHSNINIISIITRGRIRHEGTAGGQGDVVAGQVMLQCSGASGFSHNEINPDDDVAGMVQIWLHPGSEVLPGPTLSIFDPESGDTDICQQDRWRVVVSVRQAGDVFSLPEGALCYLFQGNCQHDTGMLFRGSLFYATATTLTAVDQEARIISFSEY